MCADGPHSAAGQWQTVSRHVTIAGCETYISLTAMPFNEYQIFCDPNEVEKCLLAALPK